jgi:uncharacterized membrane protein YgaE (UPF0421/DUF939 family)
VATVRLAWVIGLAVALTAAICGGIGLSGDAIAYGAVIAAVVVRPDFGRWPLAFYPVLVVLVGLCMAIGVSVGLALAGAPQVFSFGLVAVLMQWLALLLPAKLKMLAGVVAVAGVLPLLGGSPSWSDWGHQLLAISLGLATGTLVQLAFTPSRLRLASSGPHPGAAEPEEAEPPLPERLRAALRSPFFWRKLVVASLALAVGQGVGALTPKYLYFGVVLLLNDAVGDTLLRVRDRMIGVSLGILMPLLVFNAMGMGTLQTGIVMGGTTALVLALGAGEHLRTALISSGVSFIGYGPLVAWYVPNRWLDYLMGCGLALAVGLLLFPDSALRRYARLSADPQANAAVLARLLPAAQEEARWLGRPLPAEAPPPVGR